MSYGFPQQRADTFDVLCTVALKANSSRGIGDQRKWRGATKKEREGANRLIAPHCRQLPFYTYLHTLLCVCKRIQTTLCSIRFTRRRDHVRSSEIWKGGN